MKNRHLLKGYDGITVVWVDDRVLVEHDDLLKLKDNGIEPDSATCMDETWITAVSNSNANVVDAMLIDEHQKFALIALGLMDVCANYRVNLTLADFEEAHANWFRVPDAIFLLDIQNLMKPLGRFFQEDAIDNSNWNWDYYGLHCAIAYELPHSRFRFLTRFRAQVAAQLPDWASSLFPDYTTFEHNAVLIDSSIATVKRRIEDFIKDSLLHDDPCITDMVLWFLRLPLTQNGVDNHEALRKKEVLQQLNRKFYVEGTHPESAKAVALGTDNWSVCRASSLSYKLQVSVFLGILEALGLPNVQLEELSASDWLRLPCAPGLPMFLALKALIHEMNRCPTYYGPTTVTIARIHKTALSSEYRIKLFLSDLARNGTPIDISAFKSSFDEWDKAGRPMGAEHQTRQRIGDLLRCKLAVRNSYSPLHKQCFLCGSESDVLCVEFNERPSRIEFLWKADS